MLIMQNGLTSKFIPTGKRSTEAKFEVIIKMTYPEAPPRKIHSLFFFGSKLFVVLSVGKPGSHVTQLDDLALLEFL